MRKILLGTTAVVGLAVVAPAAFAQSASLIGAGNHGAAGSPPVATSGLSVRLGGFFDFTYGVVSDDADKGGGYTGTRAAGSQARQTTDMRTESEINLYVDGRASNGLQYGAVFELQMDNMTNTGNGTGVDYDELYGFVKGAWGELRFGQEDSAASLMQVMAPSVLWMGRSDAWDEFVVGSNYIGAGIGDGNDSTKIIYLSPQFNGFDFGLSYSSNRNEGEQTTAGSKTNEYQRDYTGLTNEISAALRYRGTVGGVGIQASLAAQFADAAKQSTTGASIATRDQNVTVYSAGLVLSGLLPGLQIGGDYTWGKYRTAPGTASLAQGLDDSDMIGLGAVYTTGAMSLGVNYALSTQSNGGTVDDRTQTYIGLGLAYVIAPGMTFFANYNMISDKNVPVAQATKTSTTSNLTTYGSGDYQRDITVAVAGVRVAF
jgi:Gram-negative porin